MTLSLPRPSSRFPLSVILKIDAEESLDRFNQTLDALLPQFPGVRFESNPERLLLWATSESELRGISVLLDRDCLHSLDLGSLAITYLETIRQPAEGEGKYIRQTGGRGNYGHCKIRLNPSTPGSGYSFVNELQPGQIPAAYIESIDIGIRQSLESGILRGFPIVDLIATLYDGSAHEADSNEVAFQIAASIATKTAARKAAPVVLEPVVEALIEAPDTYAGLMLRELAHHRAQIQSTESNFGITEIRAILPLVETLRSDSPTWFDLPGVKDNFRFLGYQPMASEGPGGGTADIFARKPNGPGPRYSSAAADLIFEQE
ncbi:hypothetical protein ACFPT7_23475 [Acidicapsa dinghuensis]|uniref:Translation elongation factor EFG/EF2 domain-containing protein n=1 Tax=Acidicapsa dinghuensis TaxID=2218256 RepID=A0ABW1ELX0_9BACT|nr:hypothetical protein [Acidicapsa dinghuensis]